MTTTSPNSTRATRAFWVLLVVALVTFAAPRTIATVYALLAIAATVALYRANPDLVLGRPLCAPTLGCLAFSLWGLISALWSAAPHASVGKSLALAGMAAGAELTVRAARATAPGRAAPYARALLWALLAGILYSAFEVASDQLPTRTAMTLFPRYFANVQGHARVVDGIVVAVSETNINRRVALATLFLVPLALGLTSTLVAGRLRAWLLGGLALAGAAMIGLSGHQSSQAAAIAGVAAFLGAQASFRVSQRIVGLAFCVATLLVVPVVLLAHNTLKLNEAPWLFNSARDRVVIWGYTANEVLKHPLLGVGADATPAVTDQKRVSGELTREGAYEASPSRHAHNGYLQIWFELGFTGAGLALIAGLAALNAIGRLEPSIRPYALAQFAVSAGMAAFSYSIWQMWFEAAIAAGAVALLAAAGLERTAAAADGPGEEASG